MRRPSLPLALPALRAPVSALAALALVAACGGGTPDGDGADPVDDPPVDGSDETDPPDTDVGPTVQRTKVRPTVVDAAVEAGLQSGGFDTFQRGRACLAADYDKDGRTDVYIGNPGDLSYILHNQTEPGGPISFLRGGIMLRDTLSWAGTAGDYDNDGDYDLYISMGGNEGRGYDVLFKNVLVEEGVQRFDDVTDAAGIRGMLNPETGETEQAASANGVWGDYDADGDLDLFVSTNIVGRARGSDLAGRNVLWRNEGDGTFLNVTPELGLGVHQHKTRHSTWFDFDNDGDLDLFENNYRGPGILWKNSLAESGTVGFFDATDELAAFGDDLRGADQSFASAAGDFNNDGWEDLIVFSRGLNGGDCADDTDSGEGEEGHHLFLNLEGRGFVDVGDLSGLNVQLYQRSDVPMGGQGVMGCQISDLNADGLLDVYVGNGGPLIGEVNELYFVDHLEEVELEGIGTVVVPMFTDDSDLIDFPAPPHPTIPMPAYRDGDTTGYKTHGICTADFDDDGLLELVVTNGGPQAMADWVQEPDRLFTFSFPPESRPDALKILLEGDGTTVNRDAVGAKIAVTVTQEDGTQRTIHRRVYGGSSFSGLNDYWVFFGLGFATSIDAVRITWPDGTVRDLDELPALNSKLVVRY